MPVYPVVGWGDRAACRCRGRARGERPAGACQEAVEIAPPRELFGVDAALAQRALSCAPIAALRMSCSAGTTTPSTRCAWRRAPASLPWQESTPSKPKQAHIERHRHRQRRPRTLTATPGAARARRPGPDPPRTVEVGGCRGPMQATRVHRAAQRAQLPRHKRSLISPPLPRPVACSWTLRSGALSSRTLAPWPCPSSSSSACGRIANARTRLAQAASSCS